jgi:hypothetical protein
MDRGNVCLIDGSLGIQDILPQNPEFGIHFYGPHGMLQVSQQRKRAGRCVEGFNQSEGSKKYIRILHGQDPRAHFLHIGKFDGIQSIIGFAFIVQ